MSTESKLLLGTTLQVGTLTFDEVTAIDRSGASVDLLDATHLLSTSKEYVAGMADQGELKVTAHLISGQDQKDLEDLFQSGITQTCVVHLIRRDLTHVAQHTFQGIVNNPEWNVSPTSIPTMGFTLKITGTPEILPGC